MLSLSENENFKSPCFQSQTLQMLCEKDSVCVCVCVCLVHALPSFVKSEANLSFSP